jgi:hypothetical protein
MKNRDKLYPLLPHLSVSKAFSGFLSAAIRVRSRQKIALAMPRR